MHANELSRVIVDPLKDVVIVNSAASRLRRSDFVQTPHQKEESLQGGQLRALAGIAASKAK